MNKFKFKKWFKNKVTLGFPSKTIAILSLIAFLDMLVMLIPWYSRYLVANFWEYLHIGQSDLDQTIAILGYTTLALYVPSGILADKFDNKKLLLIATFLSGVLGLLFVLGCQGVFGTGDNLVYFWYLVYVGFGASAILFFWSPAWNVLSKLGSSKEQSKLYGLNGSYNGIFGFVFGVLIAGGVMYAVSVWGALPFHLFCYFIVLCLFISMFLIYKFIPSDHKAKNLAVKTPASTTKKNTAINSKKNSILDPIRNMIKPIKDIRIWLIAFFVLGMYMFQSIFANYTKDLLAFLIPGVAVTILASTRSSILRLIISNPFGKWLEKRKSWILTLCFVLLAGLLVILIPVLLIPFDKDQVVQIFGINSNGKSILKTTLQVLLPTSFILSGIISWMLVVGRYSQLEEIPHKKQNYGKIVAILSLIGFSSDSWFFQMAPYIPDPYTADEIQTEFIKDVSGEDKYSPQKLQYLLLIAVGIALFGLLCGFLVFVINTIEMKKLNKKSYRENSKISS